MPYGFDSIISSLSATRTGPGSDPDEGTRSHGYGCKRWYGYKDKEEGASCEHNGFWCKEKTATRSNAVGWSLEILPHLQIRLDLLNDRQGSNQTTLHRPNTKTWTYPNRFEGAFNASSRYWKDGISSHRESLWMRDDDNIASTDNTADNKL